MQKAEEKRKEPLNVVALLCLVIGAPLMLAGSWWPIGLSIMLLGAVAAIAAWVRYQRHKRRA